MDDDVYFLHIPDVVVTKGVETKVLDKNGEPFVIRKENKFGFDLSSKNTIKCTQSKQ